MASEVGLRYPMNANLLDALHLFSALLSLYTHQPILMGTSLHAVDW